MADLGVKDIFFGQDLLTINGLKPWWERWHGYFMASALSAALSIFYISSSTSITCIPIGVNDTAASARFTDTEGAFVDNYCMEQIPWYVYHVGIIAVATVIVLFGLYNWWLIVPDVICSHEIFSKAEKAIENSKFSLDQWKTRFYKSDADSDTSHVLSLMRHTSKIVWYYRCRCFPALFVSAVCVGLYIFITSEIASANYQFSCFKDPFLFLCLYKESRRSVIFLSFFIICIFMQMGTICVGYCFLLHSKSIHFQPAANYASEQFSKTTKYASFMFNVKQHSHRPPSQKFRQLLLFMFSLEAVDQLALELRNGIKSRNENLISLFMHVRKNADVQIFTELRRLYTDELNGIRSRNEVRFALKILSGFKFDEWIQEARLLAQAFAKKRDWELLVLLINAKRLQIEETNAAEQNCGVSDFDLDELEYPFLGEIHKGRSLLYYVLNKETCEDELNFTAFRHVLSCATNHRRRPLFVHYEGMSTPVEGYVETRHEGVISSEEKKKMIGLLRQHQPTGMVQSNSEAIAKLLTEYKDYIAYCKDHGTESNERKQELTKDIKAVKILHWDDCAEEFAKTAAKEKHWEIFVALLNSKIVTTEQSENTLMKQECGVEQFNLMEKDASGCTILYYALRKEPISVITAAQHILACTVGQTKMIFSPYHKDEAIDAADFVTKEYTADGNEKAFRRRLEKLLGAA